MTRNIDEDTVDHFGREWSLFDQRAMSGEELTRTFNEYFSIFPWSILSEDAIGFDLGCGSGRWARFVAPRVGRLHCVDASKEALAVAKKNLVDFDNCDFAVASVDEMPMEEESMDFGYSIGVLHLVPDAAGALKHCSRKLKPGAPFLAYIYYAFDNRPRWYRLLWKMSDVIRVAISRLPFRLKVWLSGLIAVLVYWPVARLWALLESLGARVGSLPLSAYRHRSLYMMRNDALDRFGTKLEKRFTRNQIERMFQEAGFRDIRFNTEPPAWWTAVGCKIGKPGDNQGDD